MKKAHLVICLLLSFGIFSCLDQDLMMDDKNSELPSGDEKPTEDFPSEPPARECDQFDIANTKLTIDEDFIKTVLWPGDTIPTKVPYSFTVTNVGQVSPLRLKDLGYKVYLSHDGIQYDFRVSYGFRLDTSVPDYYLQNGDSYTYSFTVSGDMYYYRYMRIVIEFDQQSRIKECNLENNTLDTYIDCLRLNGNGGPIPF